MQGVHQPYGPGSGIHFNMIELKTKRLLLRPFMMADAREVQLLAGDPRLAYTTLHIPHPYEDGMAEAWIASHETGRMRGEEINLAITHRSEGDLLGAITLASIERKESCELGYWVGRPYWDQGYCTEAAYAMLKYAFEELGLERIYARHLIRNPASGRVLEKIGMTCEGRQRLRVPMSGVYEDMELWGVLREEWQVFSKKKVHYG